LNEQAKPQPQSQQSSGLYGVPTQALGLLMSGMPGLEKAGTAIADAAKPIAMREGAAAIRYDAQGNPQIVGFSPKLDVGQRLNASGGVETVPGYLPSLSDIEQTKKNISNANELETITLPNGQQIVVTKAQKLAMAGNSPQSGGGNSPPASEPPLVPGINPGQSGPLITGQTTAVKTFQDKEGARASDYAGALDKSVSTLNDEVQRIGLMKQAAKAFQPGATAPFRMQIAAQLDDAGMHDLAKTVMRGDVSSAQTFNKLAIGQATQDLKELVGQQRFTQLEFQKLQDANAQVGLSPQAINNIFDFVNERRNFKRNEQTQFNSFVANGGDPTQWQAEWNKRVDEQKLLNPPSTKTFSGGWKYLGKVK